VQRGDTLSGIGSFYGVPLFDLARVNNVRPEYFVLAGESLFVPSEPVKEGPNGYRVESGDTFYSIAYQCDLSVSYLAQVNDSNVDATLTPGQIVILPLNR
jgi:LysM repeat protein